MKRIQFSERALNDLQEIKRYTIDCWSKEQYVAYRDELINAIYALPDKSRLLYSANTGTTHIYTAFTIISSFG